ncbi:GAP1-N2 domain-containing protein [Actinocorallia populi]|uniref:GAP1-N2 domain-containing protein n=1 Tax=Actinocorallia populi TaxID=2079200 RepID=UPI000D090DD2|nr:hypothetical protein [Actinocorallia populi]
MAWQLHYTSARTARRSGFQFTAVSPGLPPGVEGAVSPYLGYRPPPDAPPSPGEEELAGFPVSFGYDVVDAAGERRLLVRSRYLGRDYSGRFGNFLAHAVVADPAEMEGLRPIEFWGAPFWADAPLEELPVLEYPPPGDAFDPEALGRWLSGLDHDPYARLAALVDAVCSSSGRIFLVSPDVGQIARWIAVLSYSLPVARAALLSFTTYTADPAACPHRLAGTTPDVWASLRADQEAHLLDGPAPRHEPSRYAGTVAGLWRALDLEGLDSLAELAEVVGDGLEGAAALLALCRAEEADEEAQGLALPLVRHPGLPSWVWPRLPVDGLSFELAAAVNRHSPDAGRARAAGERCARLVLSTPSLRTRLDDFALEDPAELLPELARRLPVAESLPLLAELTAVAERLGVPVTRETTGRGAFALVNPDHLRDGQRLASADDVVAAVVTLTGGARGTLLTGIVHGLERGGALRRRDVLTGQVCDLLAEHAEGSLLRRTPEVALHMLRSLAARHGVLGGPTLRLAEAIPGNSAAEGLLTARDVPGERDPRAAADALERVGGALSGPAVQAVADALTARSPAFRAALVSVLDERVRDLLVHRWMETARQRSERFDLVGVALRAPGTPLDGWVREQLRKRFTLLQLETYFRDDQKLRAALRELRE